MANDEKGTEKPLKVLVAGATGYLGSNVVRECKRRGYWVRALARNPEKLEKIGIKELCDDIFVGEATKDETLEGLCDGIDVVFSSIGFMTFDKKPLIWDVDYGANMNIVRRAKAAGVKHFVFTSTIGSKEMAKTVKIAEAKEAVAKALQESGMNWTVTQPTGFFDDTRKQFEVIKSRGTAYVFGSGQTKYNPIHGIDLAKVSVDAFTNPEMKNKYVPVGGPETFTHEEVALLAFKVLGKEPRIRHIPIWVLKLISIIARPFNQNLADMICFFVAIGGMELDAPHYGEHRLEDFLRTLVD
ncbi:MAG: SDR family oxidoreductase [Candidatus Schekmanbacteria bacterium]|nr:MAG: SDR family oxidoreductase [Candidatus Schekmanbacteria bacterium]